jgi:transposase
MKGRPDSGNLRLFDDFKFKPKESPMKTYYVGMDVHKASIVIAVLNGAGKLMMESTIETGAEMVRNFFKQLSGKVYVTFEEGVHANWLHDILKPHVYQVLVCDPRRNKLLLTGNKGDKVDARKLAELLRIGSLSAVYHGDQQTRALKELVRNYDCLTRDTTRVMLRLRAIFRGRAIASTRRDLYRNEKREEWLGKLEEPGVKERANSLYEQLVALKRLRQDARLAMLKEARRHPAYKVLNSIAWLGPISVAQIIAVVQTPYRFRTKRQFWAYIGLAVETNASAEYVVTNGNVHKSSRLPSTRGLNQNHNPLLKRVFKTAATSACFSGPFKPAYDARVEKGMDPSLARLTIARKLAATTLSIWKTGKGFSPEGMKNQVA